MEKWTRIIIKGTKLYAHSYRICRVWSGAIIGDGDRKSWDARGPMIWDNFSIFRTN